MNVYASSYSAARRDLERAFEVVVGLAGESDDDVGRDREVGHDATGLGQPLEVPVAGVAAVHQCQHAVAPGLERIVQVLADGRRLGHRSERLGPHVLGVGARVPNPPDPGDCADVAEQIGEQRT